MKPFNYDKPWGADRGARKPLRTLAEMAAEFGVTTKTLASNWRRHPGPVPDLDLTPHCKNGKRWYDPAAVRKWWALVQFHKQKDPK